MKHDEVFKPGQQLLWICIFGQYELNENSIPFLESYQVKHACPLILFW